MTLTEILDCLRAIHLAVGLAQAEGPGLAPRGRDAPAREAVGRLRDPVPVGPHQGGAGGADAAGERPGL